MKDTQKKWDDSEIDRSIKKHVKEICKMEVDALMDNEDSTSFEGLGSKRVDEPHVDKTLVVGVVSAVAALVAAYIITK